MVEVVPCFRSYASLKMPKNAPFLTFLRYSNSHFFLTVDFISCFKVSIWELSTFLEVSVGNCWFYSIQWNPVGSGMQKKCYYFWHARLFTLIFVLCSTCPRTQSIAFFILHCLALKIMKNFSTSDLKCLQTIIDKSAISKDLSRCSVLSLSKTSVVKSSNKI